MYDLPWVMAPKDADGTAKSDEHDQTPIWVCTVSLDVSKNKIVEKDSKTHKFYSSKKGVSVYWINDP